MSRRFSRRDLMKAAPVAGATATFAALALTRNATATASAKGVCRFCLLHCGIDATTRGDELLRVQGDIESRTRGFICQHGYALPEVVHSRHRLKAPMLRRGSQWAEVSWNEALGFVADRLNRIKAQYGAQAMMVQTGWPLVRHPLPGFLHRLVRAFGSPNLASVASLCETSVRMGQALTVGSKYPQALLRSKTLVVWGANPLRSAPAVTHAVLRCAEEKRLVVIDPTRHELAQRATEFVQVRPGSDGALALGLANLLIQERWYDADFVQEHVTGFESFSQYVKEFPPERVEQLTSISSEQLLRLAKRFSEQRPVRIWPGLGVEQHESGVQTVRAMVALEALLGSFDEQWAQSQLTPPGPRFGDEMLPPFYRMATPKPIPPAPRAKPLGYDEFPLFEVFNREAQGNLFAKAVLEDQPYPVRALLLMASNPFTTGPGTTKLLQAAQKLELLVTIDPFMTASGQLSHVVLPASTFAEAPMVEEELGTTRRNDDADTQIGAPLVSPQHQSWPDWKILVELAKALGLGEYFPWPSLQQALAARHYPYMEDPAHQPRPTVPSSSRFSTATGKIELESSLLKQFGYSALPKWEPKTAEQNADFPLLLVSGPRDVAFINSQFRKAPSIRNKVPKPLLRIHPTLGIKEGARVAIVTEYGRIEFTVKVDEHVHPQSVVAPFGWDDANINQVTSAELLDPISGFPAVRSTRCRLETLQS